jgi:3-phenylpropionate/trans-cinnamate dioxygenase ferredoxin subunit
VAGFVEVARVQDVPPGTVIVVEVGGRQPAVANVEGGFFAVDNRCPHRGGSLGDGSINIQRSEWALECLLHGSVFDVRTGEVLNPPAAVGVGTYSVEVDGRVVRVSVD